MKIDKEQILKVIDFWQKSVDRGPLFDRMVLDSIDLGGDKEIVDLVGPRRSGKSSLLKLIVKRLKLKDNFLFINFEDPFFITYNQPGIIEELISVYTEFFSPDLEYLFFDEIQEIKQWERAIRKLRDSERYKIFLTGSSSKLLSSEISSLLTGRHLSCKVFPLSFREYLVFRGTDYKGKKDMALKEKTYLKLFDEYFRIGGFPQAVQTQSQELLKNYFFDILQRDIVMRYDVREKEILEKMAAYLLSNSGKAVSIESLKSAYNISFAAASTYLEYLKDAFLVFELPQFSYSLKKQMKAIKKIYSVDPGLSNAVSFRFSEDRGRVLENIVFLELKKRGKELYYYKTGNNLEVDFLVREKNEARELIQVSWEMADKKTRQREVKALLQAMEESDLKTGLILTSEEEDVVEIEGRTIFVRPVYKWALET